MGTSHTRNVIVTFGGGLGGGGGWDGGRSNDVSKRKHR